MVCRGTGLKRQSSTKLPHDPYVLFLDEGISGDAFASRLRDARLPVCKYEVLLERNAKVPDDKVIEASAKAGYVLVTKDERMETDWVDEIITYKAKVILLTDCDGGPVDWASSLICSQREWTRVLLDHLSAPVTIRLNKNGRMTKLTGESELIARRDRLITKRVARAKKKGSNHQSKVLKQRS